MAVAFVFLLCAALAAAQCGKTVTSTNFKGPIMDPTSIPKYRVKIPNPLHPSMIFTPDRSAFGPATDYYRIGMRQITQQILPPGCPATTVWAYGNAEDPLDNPVSFHSPSKTIVAFKNRITKVQWVHTQLPTTHLFEIDRTFHCGTAANCSPDVRTVVHLHGAHVADDSDGFPDAWQSPDGKNGTLYTGNPYTYDNSQEGATLWYHDHSAGITRLNVYAGLAGFYIIRGNREMSMQSLNQLPRYPYDMPIVIQDRYFKPDGSLAYPDAAFASPRIFNHNFGNVFIANGVAWPRMLCERRKYRIRLLNGCNSRTISLRFVSTATSNPTKLPVWQIMSDGGLLNAPVVLTNRPIVLSSAERADIIVDFSAARTNEQFLLTNDAPTPYPFGTAIPAGDPMASVMLFRVKLAYNSAVPPTSNPPASLRNRPLTLPSNLNSLPVRRLQLFDSYDPIKQRMRRHLGTVDDGPLNFCDVKSTTETPAVGSTEIWEVYNPTGEMHPIHLHLVMFQVISRHAIAYVNNKPTLGAAQNVDPEELGKKDTVRVDPGSVVRIVSTFDRAGLYVWHCHLLEHEDYDMMRPLCVGGNCSKVWEDMTHMPW